MPLPPLGCLPALCLGGGACADDGPRMFKDRDHLWITPRPLVRRALTGLLPKADAFCDLRLRDGKPCVFGLSGAYTEGTIRVFLQQMGVPCVVSSFRNMSLAAPDGTTKPRGGGPTFFKARATCVVVLGRGAAPERRVQRRVGAEAERVDTFREVSPR